jgi:predicted nucleic acid-binding protein
MPKKLFLDTNILLDMAMSERPEHASALNLLDACVCASCRGFVSATSLKDVYYVLTKYAGESNVRKFILALMDVFEVVAVDAVVCKIAACSDEPDFEDGIIRTLAEQQNVDFIISRDEAAFKKSGIKRVSASDLGI